MGTRPLNSDSGARSRGPSEAPNEGMVIQRVAMKELVIPKSAYSLEAPGANIVVATFLQGVGECQPVP